MALPVAGISLDFTRGRNLDLLQQHGFPADKQLGVGIVDARNIWKIRPESVLSTLEAIQKTTTKLRSSRRLLCNLSPTMRREKPNCRNRCVMF
ncbi:MAG: hypothetical protein OHK0047_44800 [Leptolyngbyaceae cyanobacterium]